jgi:putative ATP-binding cassette transporter
VAYPSQVDETDGAKVRTALVEVGLGRLVAELDLEQDWLRRLSPGEQQRLAFARVLLQQPTVVFLDETTSALDVASEALLYQLLIERLPDCIIVSVAHRETLAKWHPLKLKWQGAEARADADDCTSIG